MKNKLKKITEYICIGVCYIIFLVIFFTISFSICDLIMIENNINERETTKLYTVDKYKVHEAGVEIWAISEDGEDYGFFIEHEDIYSYEEPNETTSRVIGIYECRDRYLKYVYYLYFSKDEFKEYIKDRYDIE